MKQILIMLALASSVFASEKPNVLLIISDDQGYSDFGFMGNPILRTPRIDQLAQSGAVFRNFVTGPACSPGRSMIYTGRNNLLTGGVGDAAAPESAQGRNPDARLLRRGRV